MHSNPKAAAERNAGDPVSELRGMADEVPNTVAELLSKGTKRAAELHKSALDMAARQNTEIFNAFEKLFKPAHYLPGFLFYELAMRTFDNLIRTEKEILDLAVQQTESVLRYDRSSDASAEQATKSAQAAFRESVDRVAAAQKTVLDFAAEQNKAVFEATRRQLGGNETASAAADSVQHSFDALITTQKKMIDNLAAPVKSVAAKA